LGVLKTSGVGDIGERRLIAGKLVDEARRKARRPDHRDLGTGRRLSGEEPRGTVEERLGPRERADHAALLHREELTEVGREDRDGTLILGVDAPNAEKWPLNV